MAYKVGIKDKVSKDVPGTDEAIDDLAGLCEHWSRNRSKGRTPLIIRDAILQLCQALARSSPKQ